MKSGRSLLIAVLAVAVPIACGGESPSRVPVRVFSAQADLVGLTMRGDVLLAGERTTGKVLALDVADDWSSATVSQLARVEVRSDGEQRGLLGIAVIGDAVFASWTRAVDGRLVVAQVDPGPTRIVWEGPESSDRATGGHLITFDGRLAIGVGDLLQRDLLDDQQAPNGKLLSLDPEGAATQQPVVLSGPWNNPFAFAEVGSGIIVADNSPGKDPELIGRGDGVPDTRVAMDSVGRAPSALVAMPDGRIGICGYLDGEMRGYEAAPPYERAGTLVDNGCRTGAVLLDKCHLAVADGAALGIVTRC